MSPALFFVYLCSWMGVFFHARAAILLGIHYFKAVKTESDSPLIWGTGSAFALMVGWTLLFFWVSLNPVNRREIFIIAAIPVTVQLLCSAFRPPHRNSEHRLPIVWLGVVLVALFLAAFWVAELAG